MPYAFDPSGTLAANKITGEQAVLTGSNSPDYYFIVPKFGPFFEGSLVIRYTSPQGEVRILTEGIDYIATHWFISASRACAKTIMGSVSFLDRTLTGIISYNYQTLGGDWTIDEPKIAEILADRLHNPRITSWDVVVDMPYSFPVIDHEWNLTDMVGMAEVKAALSSIEQAILTAHGSAFTQHINAVNPHNITPAGIGTYTAPQIDEKLALLDSGSLALTLHIEALDPHPVYFNTARLEARLAALVNLAPAGMDTLGALATAIDNNPDFATYVDGELAKKVNLSAKATLEQASAGVDDSTWMTPAKTITTISSWAVNGIPAASETVAGKARFGTNAETITGVSTSIATHPAGVKAAISSALSALINSAPEALNQLNELATALGNDPNFATTIANALAGKAPLNGVGTSGTWPISVTGSSYSSTLTERMNPLSGPASYKLGYAADGVRTNVGDWGRVVMVYDGNGQTYGVRVDRADYSDSTGYIHWNNVDARPTALSAFTNDMGYVNSTGSVNYANSAGTATNAGYATNAGNAETLDGYHAADLLANNNLTNERFSLLSSFGSIGATAGTVKNIAGGTHIAIWHAGLPRGVYSSNLYTGSTGTGWAASGQITKLTVTNLTTNKTMRVHLQASLVSNSDDGGSYKLMNGATELAAAVGIGPGGTVTRDFGQFDVGPNQEINFELMACIAGGAGAEEILLQYFKVTFIGWV
jgi:hypothetical protein